MPAGNYIRQNSVKTRLAAGLAANHVEGFLQWLRERQYTPLTVIERERLLACWTDWACEVGYAFETIRDAYKASYMLIGSGHRSRFRGDLNKDAVECAKLFIIYLEACNVLDALPVPAEPSLVAEFRQWALEQHGLAETTLGFYLHVIRLFVADMGEDPTTYTATTIRAFVLERGQNVSQCRVKGIIVSTRSFLRFLVATKRCPSGLVHALPRSANWRLTSIPRFLPDAEIERVIKACDGEDRLRDLAIILLLARLGLRASEVARLTFDDLDWTQGHIRIHGKGRRLELLPLTQEIGDAIIGYMTRQRPPTPTRALFVTVIAPIHQINRIVVKCLVNRALTRAGIESPRRGAHILRHSAATAMLRHGVSLADVGSVLRHRDTAITAHYAKVDQTLLSVIAQPWGGRAPC